MEFGVHLVQQNVTMSECRRLWRWADAAGFTWVDVSDHFYESPMTEKQGPYLECLASLTALAIDTERVRVGTGVIAMDYRHPAVLANALAAIDHLADGRLEVGLGAGWNAQEYGAYGIPFDRLGTRFDRLEEGIQVLRALWETPRADFQGEHYQLTDALCEPKPRQARVPLWIGGVGQRRTLPLIARYADGWNAPYLNVADWQRLAGVLDAACERIGRDPAEVQRDVNLSFHLAADDADRARADAHFAEVFGPAGDAFRQRGAIVGTPPQAAEALAAYAEAGVHRVNITLRPPWDWNALSAFAADVLPFFSR